MSILDSLPIMVDPGICSRCKATDYGSYNLSDDGVVTSCNRCPDQHEFLSMPITPPEDKCIHCGAESQTTGGTLCKMRRQ